MSAGVSHARNLWGEACKILEGRLCRTAYEQWFECIVPLSADEGSISLGVSDDFFAQWLTDNYGDVLSEALAEAAGRETPFSLETGHSPAPKEGAQASEEDALDDGVGGAPCKAAGPARNCHGRYTFKNFVVGEENRYAYSAAMTAAQSPGVFNPLYIYGSTGMGKTHLIQAVANQALQNDPGATVEYVTCEEFLNSYVDSLKNKTHYEFRSRFRKVDLLLIDDVHQLGNKAALQEEFFNTFNTIYNLNKQIIMTSDKQPSEIKGLELRLVSRFESGVITQITQPSYETRLAILRLKQEDHLIKLGEETISFIAARVCSSVRHLEGALMRLAAYSSAMGGVSITVSTAERILGDLLDKEAESRKVSIESIQRTVSEHFGIHIHDIIGSKRPRNIAEPRMIAMYLSRKLTNHSLPEIGMAFGGRNHATVIHAVKQIEGACAEDEGVKRTVAAIKRQLQA